MPGVTRVPSCGMSMTSGADAAPTRWQATGLRTAVWMLALSLAVLLVCGGRIVLSAVTLFQDIATAPDLQTPVDRDLDLGASGYGLYELTGTTRSSGGLSTRTNRATTLTAADVTVTGPAGESLAVRTSGRGTETITRDGRVYTAFAHVRVPSPGTYRVSVTSRQPQTVVVSRTLGSAFTGMLWWILGAVGAGLGMLVGLALLVAAVSRASRRRPVAGPAGSAAVVAAPAGAAPPGWYVDPGRPGGWRYWDGRMWTEHAR
jgi:hypothetical protein